MVKVAFFDIDGTLTDMQTHQMPASTKLALRLLREKGIKVVISTGRAKNEMVEGHILEDEHFDGYIYMNGQLTIYDGKPIDEHLMTREQLINLKNFLTENQISCIFYDREQAFCNLVNDELITQQKRIGSEIPPVVDISHLEDLKFYQFVPLVTVEQEKKMLEKVKGIKTSRWGDCIVDVMTEDGGKDAGIRKVCEYLGVDISETIGFGDGDNDISMLDICHISVAMGNASDAVKAHGNYIAKRYDEDGIYLCLKDLEII